MKERGILFSAPMVKAILDGTKTQTRRIVKPSHGSCILAGKSKKPIDWQTADYFDPFWNDAGRSDWWSAMRGSRDGFHICISHLLCPYGTAGNRGKEPDRLWVKEAWSPGERQSRDDEGQPYSEYEIGYAADSFRPEPMGARLDDFLAWERKQLARRGAQLGVTQNPLFMPRWASRITLEVTEVRVQRLQEIDHADAVAEGVPWDDAVYDYSQLWERINGVGSWAENPYVWAVSFKRIDAAPRLEERGGE